MSKKSKSNKNKRLLEEEEEEDIEDDELEEFLNPQSKEEIFKLLEGKKVSANEDFVELEEEEKDNKRKNTKTKTKIKLLIVDKDKLEQIKKIYNLNEDKKEVIKERVEDMLRHEIVVALTNLQLFRMGYSVECIQTETIKESDFVKAMKICEEKLVNDKEFHDILFGECSTNVKSLLSEIHKRDMDIRLRKQVKIKRSWEKEVGRV